MQMSVDSMFRVMVKVMVRVMVRVMFMEPFTALYID